MHWSITARSSEQDYQFAEGWSCNNEEPAHRRSVAETANAELLSYSAAVQKNESPSPVIAPETLKSVVRKVAEEEDRCGSWMVFGLSEDGNDKLHDKVSAVFQEIGEEPRMEASRLGEKKDNATRARPVLGLPELQRRYRKAAPG